MACIISIQGGRTLYIFFFFLVKGSIRLKLGSWGECLGTNVGAPSVKLMLRVCISHTEEPDSISYSSAPQCECVWKAVDDGPTRVHVMHVRDPHSFQALALVWFSSGRHLGNKSNHEIHL